MEAATDMRERRRVVSPGVAVSGVAALLCAACECSSSTMTRTGVLDDAGERADARPGMAVDASGAGGRNPADEGGTGGAESEGGMRAEAGALDAGPDGARDGGPLVSVFCGDGIRGLDEECDDGDGDDVDFCSNACRVHDAPLLKPDATSLLDPSRRELARGHHVVAGGSNSVVALVEDTTESPHSLLAAVLDDDGIRLAENGIGISDDARPAEPSDVAIAALPGNRYAVAWTATGFDGDGLGIAMRSLDATTGTVGSTLRVNSSTAGNQQHVDAVWTGSELVVTWSDAYDSLAPRGCVRRYDADLNPKGGEEGAISAAPVGVAESTLAQFRGGFALLYVEGPLAAKTAYRVHSSATDWTIPVSRFTGDPARLVGLDDDHLLAVWSDIEIEADGGAELRRVRATLLDVDAPSEVTPFDVLPLSPELTADPTRSAFAPAVAVAGGTAYVAWFLDGGGTGGRRLVFKDLPFHVGEGGAVGLDRTLVERPLPRTSVLQTSSFQEHPELAVAVARGNPVLVAAWDDGERALGLPERRPDTLGELIPLPLLRLPEVARHDQ